MGVSLYTAEVIETCCSQGIPSCTNIKFSTNIAYYGAASNLHTNQYNTTTFMKQELLLILNFRYADVLIMDY
jgi:hypothetical protein